MEWDQAQADLAFQFDLQKFDTIVAAECPNATTLQHDAMVALCYNIGPGWTGKKGPGARDGFRQSSVRRLHLAGKYPEAAQAFALWNKAGGKVSNGLVRRRAEEAAMYAEGAPTAIFDPHDYHVDNDAARPPATAEGEKSLSQSRTMMGQVGTAAATAGTVAAAKLDPQQILQDNPDLVGQILPYIAEYWWLFALAAGGFIIYTMYVRASDRNEGRS